MGTIFRLPNTDFSDIGVPIEAFLPIPNNPLMVLLDTSYNESTGVWKDVIGGYKAEKMPDIAKPLKSTTTLTGARQLVYFDRSAISALLIDNVNIDSDLFTITMAIVTSGSEFTQSRYLLDFMNNGARFSFLVAANLSQNWEMSVFTTSNSFVKTGIKLSVTDQQKFIVTLSINRITQVCDIYINGVLNKSSNGFIVEKLIGQLYLGIPYDKTTTRVAGAHVGHLSIYDGTVDLAGATAIYNALNTEIFS